MTPLSVQYFWGFPIKLPKYKMQHAPLCTIALSIPFLNSTFQFYNETEARKYTSKFASQPTFSNSNQPIFLVPVDPDFIS